MQIVDILYNKKVRLYTTPIHLKQRLSILIICCQMLTTRDQQLGTEIIRITASEWGVLMSMMIMPVLPQTTIGKILTRRIKCKNE